MNITKINKYNKKNNKNKKKKNEQHFYNENENKQAHSQINIHHEHLRNITKIEN